MIAPSIKGRHLICVATPGIAARSLTCFVAFSQAGGASRSAWGREPIAVAFQMSDPRGERGGEDGALRDLRERCDGGERCSALDRGWRCQETTRLEAAKAAPGTESAPQAIARSRSTGHRLTPAPQAVAAPATEENRQTLDVWAEFAPGDFACGKRVSNADHSAITMNQNDNRGGGDQRAHLQEDKDRVMAMKGQGTDHQAAD